MRLKYISALACMLVFLVSNAECVQLKYGYVPGESYNYTYTRQELSKTAAGKKQFTAKSPTYSLDFVIHTVYHFDDIFVLDIETEKNTVRRYIKENGALKTAVGEAQDYLPLFIEFSEKDWQVGEKLSISKQLTLPSQTASVLLSMLLKSINDKTKEAEISFSASALLPKEKLKTKEISIKGTLIFDTELCVIKKADWNTSYSLSFINKSFAVNRQLWRFETKSTHSLVLKGANKQP